MVPAERLRKKEWIGNVLLRQMFVKVARCIIMESLDASRGPEWPSRGTLGDTLAKCALVIMARGGKGRERARKKTEENVPRE